MKRALICLAMVLAAACHRSGSGDSLQRQQQQYDTVTEGQSSTAASSTIMAPGEVAPPTAGLTGTNSDTTTNFTLPQVSSTSTAQSQPGTLAGTLPVQTNAPMSGYPSNPPRPKPRPAVVVTKTETVNTDTTTTTSKEAPPPSTSTTPPNTDTAPPPPPSTDTQPPPTTTTG